MRRSRVFALAAAVFVVAAAPAEHVPGHENDDPTFPVPLPGPEHFNGGLLFVTFIGPTGGTQITSTTWDVTFQTNPGGLASELLMELSVPVDGAVVEQVVTGADLGFPAAEGTFNGTLTTDVFNGVVFNPGPFPDVVLDFFVMGDGHFIDSSIVFDVIPFNACPADLNGDGVVGGSDLAMLLGFWGECGACAADLDGDGAVSGPDLALLLGSWGECG